jgi:hypothetical protein
MKAARLNGATVYKAAAYKTDNQRSGYHKRVQQMPHASSTPEVDARSRCKRRRLFEKAVLGMPLHSAGNRIEMPGHRNPRPAPTGRRE